jgi:hypothetical protein
MFYNHSWEYDPNHPKIKFERKAMINHYTNLDKTYDKTEKLLKQFKFDKVTSIVKNYEQQHGIKTIGIEVLQD